MNKKPEPMPLNRVPVVWRLWNFETGTPEGAAETLTLGEAVRRNQALKRANAPTRWTLAPPRGAA